MLDDLPHTVRVVVGGLFQTMLRTVDSPFPL